MTTTPRKKIIDSWEYVLVLNNKPYLWSAMCNTIREAVRTGRWTPDHVRTMLARKDYIIMHYKDGRYENFISTADAMECTRQKLQAEAEQILASI